jgi:DNA modification methylase
MKKSKDLLKLTNKKIPEEKSELVDRGEYIEYPNGEKYHKTNRLNNLTSKEWLKFQKSWFILNPKPRGKDVLLHPAKFPEELVENFINFFTKKEQIVFDPMMGTGSTLVAAAKCDRSSVGIELAEKYYLITKKRVDKYRSEIKGVNTLKKAMGVKINNFEMVPIFGDARDTIELLSKNKIKEVDYIITSPPYWDMLREKGFETQKERSEENLDVYYSDNKNDIGNINDYEAFIEELVDIYNKISSVLKAKGYMTVIVKNVLKKNKLYPLAWDIATKLTTGDNAKFILKDEKIWCQDNQRLAPYGYRYSWVSNTMHHYCLNFQKK